MVDKFLKLCAVFDIHLIPSCDTVDYLVLRKDGTDKVIAISYLNLITDSDIIKALDNIVSSFREYEYFTKILDKSIITNY